MNSISNQIERKSLLTHNLTSPEIKDELLEDFKKTQRNSKDFYALRRKLFSKEHKTKMILERLFYPAKFEKIRPKWLKNPLTGRNLELDMYNKDLNIAVECDGIQNTRRQSFFQKTEKSFQEQKERDHMKRLMCKERGIKLICIPWNLPEHKIEQYIIKYM